MMHHQGLKHNIERLIGKRTYSITPSRNSMDALRCAVFARARWRALERGQRSTRHEKLTQ
jgi:hypothetical protein